VIKTVRQRIPDAWIVGGLGLAVASLIALKILVNGFDPAIFVNFSPEDPWVQRHYVAESLGEAPSGDRVFHDGKFYFVQANDPFLLDPQHNAAVLDRPLYRSQRMLFPLIAGGLGLLPPGGVVWGMILTNVLALGVGTFLAARLALRAGRTAWLGLSVPFNVGLLYGLDIAGAGIVAYLACLGGVYALSERRTWLAGSFFAAATLGRETMIIFALGVFALLWMQERKCYWRLILTPLAAMTLWQVYSRIRLAGVSGTGRGWDALSPPFVGLWEGAGYWPLDPVRFIMNLMILIVLIGFVPYAIRTRHPLVWGALFLLAFAPFLSANVWRDTLDFTRAVAPVFTAIAFLELPGVGKAPRRASPRVSSDVVVLPESDVVDPIGSRIAGH
jgi:hypothetical protein